MNIPSQEEFIGSFQSKIRSKEDQEKYNGHYISELFLRYMQSVMNKTHDVLKKDRKNISPKGVVNKLDKNFKNEYNVKLYFVSYEKYRNILMNIRNIEERYNTEDGQIRWLEENEYDIHLGNFYSIVPQEIKDKMTNWKVMNVSLNTAIEVREKIKNIEERYNTEDGQIRWLEENGYDIHLGSFYSIVPQEIIDKMTNWNKMNLPLNTAIEVRKKIRNMEESYNTEDGQIRWLEENGYDIHLSSFYSIVPREIRDKMTNWKMMNVSLKTAIEVRKKLRNIEERYNTEDGQIRWLEENGYDIHLSSFYSIVPQEIKEKMTNWKVMYLALKTAIKVRKKLRNIEERYNTEDGQIRWLEENGYDIHLSSFYSIVSQEIKDKMTNWKVMYLALKTAIEVRKKLRNIEESYNTEDGQIRWLEENGYDIHLSSFYSIVPREIKDKMTNWKYIKKTFIKAKAQYEL